MGKIVLIILAFQFLLLGCNKSDSNKAKVYYINSQSGNDSNNGISTNAPWKSLKKLQENTFQPGDSVLFAKSSVFQGGTTFKSSGNAEHPIVISSYGNGAMPSFSNPDSSVLNGNVFQISASHIVISDLSFSECAAARSKDGKSVLEVGAIFTQTMADHITIKNCEFTDSPIGVNITGQHSLITNNIFKNCNRFLSAPHWGPLGIVIANAYNEISYNTCSNYVKIGGNYGADGGFIELDDRFFGTKVHDIKIHHNKSFDNMGFLEIEGQVEGSNIDVYYNLSDDYQEFIFYWGGDSSKVENNTVIRTKPSLNGAVNTVFSMKNANFTIRNNIFVVANGIQVLKTAPYEVGNYDQVIHENNIYYSVDGSTNDPLGKALGEGEIIADPGFVNIKTNDYQLGPASPAINGGLVLGYSLDLNNVALGKEQIPDIGAYEKMD